MAKYVLLVVVSGLLWLVSYLTAPAPAPECRTTIGAYCTDGVNYWKKK